MKKKKKEKEEDKFAPRPAALQLSTPRLFRTWMHPSPSRPVQISCQPSVLPFDTDGTSCQAPPYVPRGAPSNSYPIPRSSPRSPTSSPNIIIRDGRSSSIHTSRKIPQAIPSVCARSPQCARRRLFLVSASAYERV